jgi:D-alanyl-D-alanine carboxypeptidase
LFAEMRHSLPSTYGYGLGFYSQRLSCGTAWGHAGGIIGYNSYALTSLDGKRRLEFAVTPYEPTPEANATLGKLMDVAYCG